MKRGQTVRFKIKDAQVGSVTVTGKVVGGSAKTALEISRRGITYVRPASEVTPR